MTKYDQLKQKHLHKEYDVAVIGAGIYGRYLASELKNRGVNVVLIAEDDSLKFQQSKTGVASLVNQARIHNGYHYPRSITTAMNSVKHYKQFIEDFKPAVIDDFKQVYAIPKHASLTNSQQFEEFCKRLNVRCDDFSPSFINKFNVDKSWLTDELAIDTQKMMSIMKERSQHVDYLSGKILKIRSLTNRYSIELNSIKNVYVNTIFNFTYAGIQEIEKLIDDNQDLNLTQVKYEACEISLFKLPENVERIGLTVMDGPFVSFMPFTNELWSLTSVVDTPHYWSLQKIDDITSLKSKYHLMKQRLSLYVNEDFLNQMEYVRSEFVVKTIPLSAENDDNRLIHINQLRKNFISILSGKLNAIYELDKLIEFYMKGEYTIND